MKNPSTNYFTCTLGEASEVVSSDFRTINKLLQLQAQRHSSKPAVAFPSLQEPSHKYFSLTFRELYEGSLNSAACLSYEDDRGCVALLCASSLDFLFACLGLIRAGYSVLLIAPQCSPSAIDALCKSCNVSRIYHDEGNTSLASAAAAETESSLTALPLPWIKIGIHLLIRANQEPTARDWPELTSQDIAYIHHSSGTSSGIPKPIPQTHHGAVAVLPCLTGHKTATFTTTPLYHGGIADCFRAWTSNALIWLFPGADAPITSTTILSCLSIAAAAQNDGTPVVRYFSSVPYVLQMLSETAEGLKALQEMDIVGVGGAALPASVGDRLVSEDVNLISRYGSAECGFLLSSHRQYASDKEWQYLRVLSSERHLHFENDGSDLSELIVLSSWPHMAKRNRDDGSYATCDLFQPHPTIKDAWKYHSRSDSQITLLTGKKFDPAPIEDEVKSSSALIDDIFIFGDDRQIPGALVFVSSGSHLSGAFKEEIWQILQDVNSRQQPHAKISQNMFSLLKIPTPPLERSSKGTLLRKQAEARFSFRIDDLYRPGQGAVNGFNESVSVDTTVRTIFAEVMGDNDITDDADFFHHGVDSTKATQIRSRLQQVFAHDSYPWNIVYDCGNINELIRYFTALQKGIHPEVKNEHGEMMQLVEKFSHFTYSKDRHQQQVGSGGSIVILTGATGSLGAHILNGLRNNSSFGRIICLVRASDSTKAWARVSESLRQRKLAPLPLQDSNSPLLCIPVKFGDSRLGLSAEIVDELRKATTHIVHAAWAVNFSLPLQSFVQEHIAGLRNLIKLSLSCRDFQHFVFCSSTASVIGQAVERDDNLIREQIYSAPPPAESLGYSKSKWVAEAICSQAYANPHVSSRMSILRVGQLTGDTKNGVWNQSEAWPLMLSTVQELGCLPNLEESLSWLPVDIAAQAVVDISGLPPRNSDPGSTVCHLVNNDQTSSWKDLLCWLQKITDQEFSVVEPNVWLGRLEKTDHPAKSLLGLWKSSFGQTTKKVEGEASPAKEAIVFDTTNAAHASSSMRHVGPIDEKLVEKIWHWLQKSGTKTET